MRQLLKKEGNRGSSLRLPSVLEKEGQMRWDLKKWM